MPLHSISYIFKRRFSSKSPFKYIYEINYETIQNPNPQKIEINEN